MFKLFSACVVVLLTSCFQFFFSFSRGFFTILVGTYFSVEEKQSPGGVPVKKVSRVSCKVCEKTLVSEFFLLVKLQDRDLVNFEKNLRTPIL